ncbi:MAG: class I SAM-dependent methyltransferase [Elusimicrobiota bacterium]
MSGGEAFFYADPSLYDLIHADGTDDEVWLLDYIAKQHGNGGKTALEPACGTGRYMAGLLRRGWEVDGYDISPKMVAYAKKRLAKYGPRANVTRGDMTSFRPKRRYDLAFNLLSTFRHLHTDKDAVAHLRGTYDALNPGGLFILGLDLAVYGQGMPDEEVWEARRSGKSIRHVMMTLPPEKRTRREKIINFVHVDGKVLESTYDLRSYDSQQIAALVLRTKFSLPICYGYNGKPASLCGDENALWLVLKKN